MSKRIFSIYLWTLWWVSVPFQHLREVSSGGDCRGVSTYSEGNSGNKNKPIICWTLNRVNSKSNSIPKAFSPYWIHCAHWIRCISRQYLPWSIFELQPCRVCWNIPERSNHNIIDSAWPKSWQPLQKGFKKNTKKLDRKKNYRWLPKSYEFDRCHVRYSYKMTLLPHQFGFGHTFWEFSVSHTVSILHKYLLQ